MSRARYVSRSTFLGTTIRPDGYAGAIVTCFVCRGPDAYYVVTPTGYFRIPFDCWNSSLEREGLVLAATPRR